MKSVLISIQPKWCELIANGKKTIEVRKTKPKIATPFKCYIYCTKAKEFFSVGGGVYFAKDELYRLPTGEIKFGDSFELDGNWSSQYSEDNFYNGKVIGEFVCDHVECFTTDYRRDEEQTQRISEQSCVDMVSLMEYEANAYCLYGWHISEFVIYDKPKALTDFYVWKKCNSCKTSGYEVSACSYDEDCKVPAVITRPPQSWCYIG